VFRVEALRKIPEEQLMTDQEKADKLLRYVSSFIERYKIGCEEDIFQCDWLLIEASNFMGHCCEIVGYCNDETEESN
jgi:hypothetical protein